MRHKKRFRHKLCEYSKGALSLLLAVVLLPFYSLAAVLVEGGRYQSSAKALDAALGSSAMSVLSEYESYLYDRFGLLAVQQTDDKDLLNKEISKYLGLQKTVDMGGVSVDSVQGAGVYPLSDPDVLKQQIQDYSSVLLPAELVTQGIQDVLDSFFDSDEMKNRFEDLKSLSTQLSSGANLLSSEADLLSAMEDSKSKIEAVAQAASEYDTAYGTFSGDVEALLQHLKSDRPDEKDEKALAEWEEKADKLREAAGNSAAAYSDSVQASMDALNALHDSMGSVMSNIASMSSSVSSFTATTSTELIKVDGDEESVDVKNAIKMNESLADAADEVSQTAQNVVDAYTDENFQKVTSSLDSEKNKIDEFKADKITQDSESLQESEYHGTDLARFGNSEELNTLFAEMDQGMGEEGGMDLFLALFDIVSSLFNTDLFVDGRLNSVLDMEYYNSTYGGLPSAREDPQDPDFVAEDADMAQKYKDAIGSFQPSYGPDGTESTGGAKIDSGIDTLEGLIDSGSALEGGADMSRSEVLKNSSGMLEFGAALCSQMTEIGSIMSNMANNFLQRELLIGYLTYNLPNRTDYDSGKTLSGYSYGNAALAPMTAESNIPIVGGLLGTNTNYAFCGAELEYILAGNASEYTNQSIVFLQLWITRLALDLVPVLSDSDLQTLLRSLQAIPVVGPVVMVVCEIVAILAEPLLDTYVLVNGGKVPIYKLDGIYLSPSGIPNLISEVSDIAISESLKTSITDKANTFVEKQKQKIGQTSTGGGASSGSGVSLDKGTSGSSISLDKGSSGSSISLDKGSSGTTNKGSGGGKKDGSFLKIDYRTHLILLMTVFGNEHTYLKRLADLVQCEMTQRNRVDNATIQQGINGKYYDFDVDKAYTTIRVQATGSTVQVLPVPSLSANSQFRLNRVIYRGY